MLNKIKQYVSSFFKEVYSDISKINFVGLFTNTKFIIILVLAILAGIVIFTDFEILTLIKGVVATVVFYFIFMWRKK